MLVLQAYNYPKGHLHENFYLMTQKVNHREGVRKK